jgi:UDP-glucose 4-epimerase
VIPLFVAALLEGRRPTIFGDGSQSRDFTYVANVVAANLRAAAAPGVSGKVYNVACGSSLSVLDLLEEICRLLGKPFNPELGYAPTVDLHTGLKQTVEWYVGHPG